jgi:hypothetical protein
MPWPGASGKKEFLFLFDYGDEWHFGVKLVRQSPTVETGVRYPSRSCARSTTCARRVRRLRPTLASSHQIWQYSTQVTH